METLWEHRYARRMNRMGGSAIRELLKLTAQEDMISFAGGLPAPEGFPVDSILDASRRVLLLSGSQALQYSTTEGYLPLRQMIVRHTARYGFQVTPDNVLMTTGSQQALDLLGKVFINPGDRVLVEEPTFLGALQAWDAYGAEYVPIPVDEDGMQMAALEAALRSGPKFIYALPNFQNPTGATLSLKRRFQLVQLAREYGVPIIEDDPYGQLRYEGQHLPPLVVVDGELRRDSHGSYRGNVIYLSTFSKILAPGFRLGWVIAPPEVLSRLVQVKQGADLHSPTFIQMMVYEATSGNFLDRHIRDLRALYRRRRDAMLAALETYMPPGVRWTRPQGGLFLWVTLPEDMDAKALLYEGVRQRVAYVPGGPFYPCGGGKNTLRLNFSNAAEEKIQEGISRLGEVFSERLLQTAF